MIGALLECRARRRGTIVIRRDRDGCSTPCSASSKRQFKGLEKVEESRTRRFEEGFEVSAAEEPPRAREFAPAPLPRSAPGHRRGRGTASPPSRSAPLRRRPLLPHAVGPGAQSSVGPVKPGASPRSSPPAAPGPSPRCASPPPKSSTLKSTKKFPIPIKTVKTASTASERLERGASQPGEPLHQVGEALRRQE